MNYRGSFRKTPKGGGGGGGGKSTLDDILGGGHAYSEQYSILKG